MDIRNDTNKPKPYTVLRDTRDPHATWDSVGDRPTSGWILQERKWREIVRHFESSEEMLAFIFGDGHALTDCHHWSFWRSDAPEKVYVVQSGEMFQNCQDKLRALEIKVTGRIPQTVMSERAES